MVWGSGEWKESCSRKSILFWKSASPSSDSTVLPSAKPWRETSLRNAPLLTESPAPPPLPSTRLKKHSQMLWRHFSTGGVSPWRFNGERSPGRKEMCCIPEKFLLPQFSCPFHTNCKFTLSCCTMKSFEVISSERSCGACAGVDPLRRVLCVHHIQPGIPILHAEWRFRPKLRPPPMKWLRAGDGGRPPVTSSSQKLNKKEPGSSRLQTSFCAALRLCFSPPHAAGLTTLLWIGALFGKHNSSCLTAEPLNQHSQRPHGPESIEKTQTLVREPSHSEHQSYLTSPRIRIPSGRQRTCCWCCCCRRWRGKSALSAWRRRSMWLNGKWEINFLGRDPWTEGLLKAQRSQSLCRQKKQTLLNIYVTIEQ